MQQPKGSCSFEDECRRYVRSCSRQQVEFYLRHLSCQPPRPSCGRLHPVSLLLLPILCGILAAHWPRVRSWAGAEPCLVTNNFILMEATRPPASCDACATPKPVRLHRPSPEQFAPLAYAGRPVLVSGATDYWPAMGQVDLAFIRRLYARVRVNTTVGEDGCQFLAFRSGLETLDQLLDARLDGRNDSKWYIGWSNCDPRVAAMLRGLYSWPDFLPTDGEGSAIDWIFMGTPGQGTAVHIDNVHRPSWQAQIGGSKRWRLYPPPECEAVCSPFTVDVHPGDIFLLDTNQWYHGTEVIGNDMSITIGSEYD